MKKSNIIIIIIDDLLQDNDPLIVKLQQDFQNVRLFNIPQESLDYISENLNNNIIVLLDIRFTTNEPDGHEILDEIRNLSFLIPVILWSAYERQQTEFHDFINNKAFAFVHKEGSGYTAILEAVQKAKEHLNSSVDGALQEWITLQDKDKRDKSYLITAHGKQYTLNQLLEEIRQQTTFGQEIKKDMLMLTIDLLLRGKKEIK